MSTYYWVASSSGDWSVSANWASTSGGTGGAGTPGGSDMAVFDAGGSGDCTLSANLGAITDNGAGDYTITPGLLGILIASDYAGTFSDGGHAVALGTSGFDATGASSATVTKSATWATLGGYSVQGVGTLADSGSVIMSGGTDVSRLALRFQGYSDGFGGLVIAAAAYVDVAFGGRMTGDFHGYGDLRYSQPLQCFGNTTTYADFVASGSTHYSRSNSTIATPENFDVATFIQYTDGGTYTAGNSLPLAADFSIRNSYTGALTIAAGAAFNAVLLDGGGAGSTTVAFNANAIYGGISETAYGAGSITLTGSIVRAGTADASWDWSQADDSGLTVGGSVATAGTLTLGGDSDFTLSDAWGAISYDPATGVATTTSGGRLTLDASYVGTLDLAGYDFCGEIDASAATSSAAIDLGESLIGIVGTLYFGSANITRETSTLVFCEASAFAVASGYWAGYNVAIATGASVTTDDLLGAVGALTVWGTPTAAQLYVINTGSTLACKSSADLSGVPIIRAIGNGTIIECHDPTQTTQLESGGRLGADGSTLAVGDLHVYGGASNIAGDVSAGNVTADTDINVTAGSYLGAYGTLTIASGATVDGDGEVGYKALASSGTLDPAALRLIDWDAQTPPTWTKKMAFEASADATAEITPTLSAASYAWESLALIVSGDQDLTLDLATYAPAITLSGDLLIEESSSGNAKWAFGGEPVRLDGGADQVVSASLSVHGAQILNAIRNENTSGAVIFTGPCRTIGYEAVDGAVTVGEQFIRAEHNLGWGPTRYRGLATTLHQGYAVHPGGMLMPSYEPIAFAGQVPRGNAPLCLARIDYESENLLDSGDIQSVEYTIYLCDSRPPYDETPVAGHEGVFVNVQDALLDAPVVDEHWTFDTTGYNFTHHPDIRTNLAFDLARRNYAIEYTLTPFSGNPFALRFRVSVI